MTIHNPATRIISAIVAVAFTLTTTAWAMPCLAPVRGAEGRADERINERLFRYLCGQPEAKRQNFKKDEEIFRQGDEPGALYIVETGEVKIEQEAPDGTRREIASLGPRHCFGEMALLTGLPRTASIVAAEDTKVIAVSKEELPEVCKREPELAHYLAAISRKRFGELTRALPVLEKLIEASQTAAEGNLFYGMNIAQLVYVALMGKEIKVDHVLIIREGEVMEDGNYSVFALLDGKLVVRRGEEVAEDIVIKEPGVIVGELAHETPGGRTATVEATAWLLELDGRSYQAIRERLAPFDVIVQHIIEERQRQNQQAIESRLKKLRPELLEKLVSLTSRKPEEEQVPHTMQGLREVVIDAAKKVYTGIPRCLETFEFIIEKRRYAEGGTSLHIANGPSLIPLAEAYFGQQVWLNDISYEELHFPNMMARVLRTKDKVHNVVADVRNLDAASDTALRPLPKKVDHITIIDLFGGTEYIKSMPHGQLYYNVTLAPELYARGYVEMLKAQVTEEAKVFAREVCEVALERVADGGDIIMTVDSPRSSVSNNIVPILEDVARQKSIILEFDQDHELTQHDSHLVCIRVDKSTQTAPAGMDSAQIPGAATAGAARPKENFTASSL